MLTYAQKKYLFAIYTLSQKSEEVRSAEVAGFVGVSRASTVKMTRRLTDGGYILKEPYGRITLTDEGIKAANSLFTDCLILSDFLEKQAGVAHEKAASDAVTIMSRVSEETAEGLMRYILAR